MRIVLGIGARRRIDALATVAVAIGACAAAPGTASQSAAPQLHPGPAIDAAAPPVHVVRPGETLSHIARDYAVDVEEIALANQLVDADRIAVGQRLSIPDPAPETDRAEALVEQAAELYRNARFDLALDRAQQAEAMLAAREGASDPEPRRALGARAAFITGCAHAAFGRNEQAVTAFSKVRTLDPGFEPPIGWLSPRLEKLYLAAWTP